MHVRCPHCQFGIELDGTNDSQEVTCPSCASVFPFHLDSSAETTKTNNQLIAHFQLVRLLGAGAFGAVWLAQDQKLDRQVALKIPRFETAGPEYREQFLREARAAARLSHAAIVPVYEFGWYEDHPYIASEYIRGETLKEALRKEPIPDFRRSAELVRHIAEGLAHAHQRSLVHRDVKPGNILMDEEGRCRLADFGLAKLENDDHGGTQTGQVVGTLGYMSPEQAKGDGKRADARSDLYSVGTILYELLTGMRPFRLKRPMLLVQIISEEPVPPRTLNKSVPIELETICLKLLEKDPNKRYQTGEELAAELTRWLDGEPILARPLGRTERCLRSLRRYRLQWLLGLSVGLIGVLTAWLVLMPDRGNTVPVMIETEPPAERIEFVRIHEVSRGPDPRYETEVSASGELLYLEPGRYIVRAYGPAGMFHEVVRTFRSPEESRRNIGIARYCSHMRRAALRKDGTVVLPPIRLFPTDRDSVNASMLLIDGGEFTLQHRNGRASQHRQLIPDLYVDRTEITYAQFARELEQSIAEGFNAKPMFASFFPDVLQRAASTPDLAVTGLPLDAVLYFFEATGRRLMTQSEYQWLATNGGTTAFPNPDWAAFGEDPSAPLQAAGERTDDVTSSGLIGLASNALEYTSDSTLGLAYRYPQAFITSEEWVRNDWQRGVDAAGEYLSWERMFVSGGDPRRADDTDARNPAFPTIDIFFQWPLPLPDGPLPDPSTAPGRIVRQVGFRGARAAAPETRPAAVPVPGSGDPSANVQDTEGNVGL